MKFDSMRAWNEGMARLRANRDMLVPLAGVFIMLPGLALLTFFPSPEPAKGADFSAIVALMQAYFREFWLQIAIAALITSIGSLAIVALLVLRERPTVSGAITKGLRALLPLIAAQMMFGAAVMLGGSTLVAIAAATGFRPLVMMAVLVACGFAAYFFIRIILLSPTLVCQLGLNPVAALRRSAQMTRGSFWQLLAFFLLVTVAGMVVTGLIDGLFQTIFSFALSGETARFAGSVVTSITQTAASVLNIALICSSYRQLSGDTERVAATFD